MVSLVNEWQWSGREREMVAVLEVGAPLDKPWLPTALA
jgi:hypothetical protein